MAYLLLPAHKGETTAGWLSYLPALAVLAITLYLSTQGRNMTFQSWVPPTDWQFALAVALFALVIEAGRRSGGMIFTSIVLFFGLYPVFAHNMPGIFWGPPFPISRTIGFNIYSGDALLGIHAGRR